MDKTNPQLEEEQEKAKPEQGEEKPEKETALARPVAPEDIRPGVYIAILYVALEYFTGCDESWQPLRLRRIDILPGADGGTPLRVREVCLPYLLVEQPDGRHRTIDVRRYRLAVLSERYAEKSIKRLAARPKSGLGSI